MLGPQLGYAWSRASKSSQSDSKIDGPRSTEPDASPTVAAMKALLNTRLLPWLAVVLAGVVLPAVAMLMLRHETAPLALFGGPILAVGLMAVAMIAAATAGRWWIGVLLALLAGVGLIQLARALGMPPLPHPFSTGLAVIIASCSFAARGTLFFRASPRNGWVLAVFVVAGEAAMLVTASYLPACLLVLLPAQWASTAIQTALTGTGTWAASSALFALGGTAATTLVVARLWPRRWPYVLMFLAWLGLSALVWHRPGPPPPRADLALALASTRCGPIAPIAISALDAATASALDRVQKQIRLRTPCGGR